MAGGDPLAVGGAVYRQFSECLHLADPQRDESDHAALPLSEMRPPDPGMGKYSGHQLALSAGKMQRL